MQNDPALGYVFMGSIVAVVLLLVSLMARQGEKSWKKRAGWIQCDVCDELMRPDGLHIKEDHTLFFPTGDRMYRHNIHMVNHMLGKPIIDPRRAAIKERARDTRGTTTGEKRSSIPPSP